MNKTTKCLEKIILHVPKYLVLIDLVLWKVLLVGRRANRQLR